MGNFVDYIDEFYADDLSQRANDFINAHRQEWDAFMINFRRSIDLKMQSYMDQAIEKIRPALDSYNTEEHMEGEEIWAELWRWLVENNREKVF